VAEEDNGDNDEFHVPNDGGFADCVGHGLAEDNCRPESGVQEFMFDPALYRVDWEACERLLNERGGCV